jgi:hypothetical protein
MLFYSHVNGQIQGVVPFKREQVLTNRFHNQWIRVMPLQTMTKLHANRPKNLGPLSTRGQDFSFQNYPDRLGFTQPHYALNTSRSFFGIKAIGTWSCLLTSSVASSSTRVFVYVSILFKIVSVNLMTKAVAFETSNVYSGMHVLLGQRRKSFYLLVVLQVAPFSRNSIVHMWIQTCISPYELFCCCA